MKLTIFHYSDGKCNLFLVLLTFDMSFLIPFIYIMFLKNTQVNTTYFALEIFVAIVLK